MNSYSQCNSCGHLFHLEDLDAKDDGTGNFEILECKDCYGEGYVSAEEQFGPDWKTRRKVQKRL